MSLVEVHDVSMVAALVQRIVDESGNSVEFDALAWTARWLDRPLPALGGIRPAQYMATPEGRTLVKTLILRMQSCAYS